MESGRAAETGIQTRKMERMSGKEKRLVTIWEREENP